MQNSVIVYSTSCCSKPVWVSLVCWTQKNIYFKDCCKSNRLLSGYQHSSKYLILCSEKQRNSYKFGRTWGWV